MSRSLGVALLLVASSVPGPAVAESPVPPPRTPCASSAECSDEEPYCVPDDIDSASAEAYCRSGCPDSSLCQSDSFCTLHQEDETTEGLAVGLCWPLGERCSADSECEGLDICQGQGFFECAEGDELCESLLPGTCTRGSFCGDDLGDCIYPNNVCDDGRCIHVDRLGVQAEIARDQPELEEARRRRYRNRNAGCSAAGATTLPAAAVLLLPLLLRQRRRRAHSRP